jgi:hypothetical protein
MAAKRSLDNSNGTLRKERGVWVYRTGRPLTAAMADRVLRRIRDERDRQTSQAGVTQ